MKKIKVLGLMALMTFALAGCQPESNSENEEKLEQQVAQLEQEVTSLEKEKEELAVEIEKTETPAAVKKEKKSEDNLDSLKDAVAKAVKDAESTKTSDSREENQNRFFKAKGKLQEVENRLDLFEDDVESQYRQGKLDYEKARNSEIEIEKLEDQLDNAEDKLELRFGYDD